MLNRKKVFSSCFLSVAVFSSSLVAQANGSLCRVAHPAQSQQAIEAAAWEISRQGISEMLSETYGQENAFYYSLTALLSREHIMLDGPGGGAKTLAIRSAFDAQIRAVQGPQDRQEIDAFKRELMNVIWSDRRQTNPNKRIFTQQFHATLSETKILGGPDPFKFVNDGQFENDYSRALIADKNMYAILDELEKAPVALQMTLLSILNERQALAGNKIVQTALESVASTTNATLGQMIAQALPHEVGGRKAMIDRFAMKAHVVNVAENAQSLFLMIEKVEAAKGQKKFTIIDLRNLQHLIDQVDTSKEVLDAMTDISLHMDRFYATKMARSYADLQGPKDTPKYYPPFSGSTRSQGKVPRLWTAAFLIRQLMNGVPHESLKLQMNAKDLVDIAPAILHGGPDVFVPEKGVRVPFFQASSSGFPLVLGSNSSRKRLANAGISEGLFDPQTGIFSYVSSKTQERRHLYYDVKTKQLIALDPAVREEVFFDEANMIEPKRGWERYGNLQKTLQRLSDEYSQRASSDHPALQYVGTGRLIEFINGSESPLRRDAKAQLKEIEEAQSEFLSIVNGKLNELKGSPQTPLDPKPYRETEAKIADYAQRMRTYLSQVIRSNYIGQIEDASAASVVNAMAELKYRFLEAGSNIKGLMVTMLNRKNAMLFGPPGSGKTLLGRTLLAAEVEYISEAQVAQANSVLSQVLLENAHGEHSIWIKQFHPMSNEGDVVGRIDLKQVREGHGYAYNRSGSLSAKDVLFGLLDEFEKAPPGVKTALLSLLNERQLLDGDEVLYSNLIAVVINTNATPGQFMTGLGDFSTAFPVFDRIHQKIYSLNKLTDEGLREFQRRNFMGFSMKLKSPFFIHPLHALTKTYRLESHERRLLTQIHQAFMTEAVEKSEVEREMFNGEHIRDFYMNSRGESNRSSISGILSEFQGAATFNKILAGKKPSQLRRDGNRFDLVDLEAFGELYLTYNGFYSITHEGAHGMIHFKVQETDLSSVMDRLDPAEKKTIEDLKFEYELMVKQLNHFAQKFIDDQKAMIAANPNLYPSLFASPADREAWARVQQSQQDQTP